MMASCLSKKNSYLFQTTYLQSKKISASIFKDILCKVFSIDMRIKSPKTKIKCAVFTVLASLLSLAAPADAIVSRSVLNEAAPIFSYSMRRFIPQGFISTQPFSRYAKFDGEEKNKHIARAQELRNADNRAWKEASDLRDKYNADWDAFQEKYFPKQEITMNSRDSTSHPIYYSGGSVSSQKPDSTSSFMAGYLTRDVTDFIFGKSTTKTDASTTLPESPPSYSKNSSDSHRSSNNKTHHDSYSSSSSSDWGSSDSGDSGCDGDSDD